MRHAATGLPLAQRCAGSIPVHHRHADASSTQVGMAGGPNTSSARERLPLLPRQNPSPFQRVLPKDHGCVFVLDHQDQALARRFVVTWSLTANRFCAGKL